MVSSSESLNDLSEKRLAEAEWQDYEFYEKIEARLRRRKWIIIFSTILLFLLLSAIPVFNELAPKWTARKGSRILAEQITWLKSEASVRHLAYRIRFPEAHTGSTHFLIEAADSGECEKFSEKPTLVREGEIYRDHPDFQILSPKDAERFGLKGVVDLFCYEPVGSPVTSLEMNSHEAGPQPSVWGFVFLPAKDLAQLRDDRLSILLINNASADLKVE